MRKLIGTIFILSTLIITPPAQPAAETGEVLIGYFGPSLPAETVDGDMWSAACLAIEEANQAGGYKGGNFRLVPGWSKNPWGSGIKEVVRMAFEDKVCAIIGGIDGPSTHLAEQVVAKAFLPLINPASTDKTINYANVPWMFSLAPPDDIQAPVLAAAIYNCVGAKSFIQASATDHDSHLFAVELGKSFVKHDIMPDYHFEFEPGQKDFSPLVKKIISAAPNALVIIAGAPDSAHLISAVRKQGFSGVIFGPASLGSCRFSEEAGTAAEGVIFPQLYVPGKSAEDFEKKFVTRFGKAPDYLAAHTYDAVNLLIRAIQTVGPDRTRLRDTLIELSPWQGVTGEIRWDSFGRNTRDVVLGRYEGSNIIGFQAK